MTKIHTDADKDLRFMFGHLPLVIVVGLLILFSPTLWMAAQAFVRALSSFLSKRRETKT